MAFFGVEKVWDLFYPCAVPMLNVLHFPVSSNKSVAPDCLRKNVIFIFRFGYCNVLPVWNNLFVKDRRVVIKIKKLNSSVPPTLARSHLGMYYHGASEFEHNLLIQFSFSAFSKREKKISLIQVTNRFLFYKSNFLYFRGFVISDKVECDPPL